MLLLFLLLFLGLLRLQLRSLCCRVANLLLIEVVAICGTSFLFLLSHLRLECLEADLKFFFGRLSLGELLLQRLQLEYLFLDQLLVAQVFLAQGCQLSYLSDLIFLQFFVLFLEELVLTIRCLVLLDFLKQRGPLQLELFDLLLK